MASTTDTDRSERTSRLVLAVAVLAAGLAVGNPLAYVVLVGLAIVTPLERWRPLRPRRVLRPELATDVIHAVVSLALHGLLTYLTVLVLDPVVPVIAPVAAWVAGLPLLVAMAVSLAAFDLAGYVSHRLQHEVPFLWRFHRIHHSSEELDWIAGARVHPLPGVLDGLFRAVPALLLGLSEATAGLLGVILAFTALLTHANVSWQLPRLSRWWATPAFHHWHHAGEPDAVNHNYAGLLPIWDRLFGTFVLPGRFPHRYGADRPVPAGWWGQMLDPLRRSPDNVR
jgi:sterol desaturase/sphingolipid hydroxylase (fatty acid hydroxylase superfamily)